MDDQRDKFIIKTAKEERSRYWKKPASVSEATRASNMIHREWQKKVKKKYSVECDYEVTNGSNAKIDLVDSVNKIAYELKVSGNNISHEFYKNICKVITYNCYKDKESAIKELVFMCDFDKIELFSKRLDDRFVESILSKYGIKIRLLGLKL